MTNSQKKKIINLIESVDKQIEEIKVILKPLHKPHKENTKETNPTLDFPQ